MSLQAPDFKMETATLAIEFLLERAGSVYTAGPAVEHAHAVCESLGADGVATTVCYWNSRLDSPRTVLGKYSRLLDVIRDLAGDCYLSIKAPALGFDFGLIKEILYRAE